MNTHVTEPVFDIPRLPRLVMDGQRDDWDAAGGGFQVGLLLPAHGPTAVKPRAEFAGSVRLGWNEAGLVVLVEVSAPQFNESAELDKLWQRDSLELYLAPRAGGRDQCQWLIAPGMDAAHPEPRVYHHDHRRTAALKKLPAEVTVARQRTTTGYRLEAVLPWASLGIQPQPGREIGFQIMVNSWSSNALYNAVWFPVVGAAQDYRKMQRLRLATRASPAIRARAILGAGGVDVFALTGRVARLVAGGRTLARGELRADESGYRHVRLQPPGELPATVGLEVDGRPAGGEVVRLTNKDYVSRLMTFDATAEVTRARITLRWTADEEEPTPSAVTVSRREPGGRWVEIGTARANEFVDRKIERGRIYEYGLHRAGDYPKWDYFWAGAELPVRDERGAVLLLVDATQAAGLAMEIARLVDDLTGDGWRVVRREVARSATVLEVKDLIRAEAVDSVFLLGHIPVPYAGDLCPDGHESDHKGAWPADVYYGDLTGAWTDSTVTNSATGRQRNVPGDGRFDQSQIPGEVRLAVGRVDFADLPAFAETEQQLLKRYLDRNHAFRHKQLVVPARALVWDGFPTVPGDLFGYTAWQNFTTLLGATQVEVGHPFEDARWRLWTFACGPGGYQHLNGLGTTQTFVERPFRSVFALFMGSYFADWDTPNNLLRAALANSAGALAVGWAGRPHWYLHPLAFGATLGDCVRLTQNNGRSGYSPVGYGGRGVHIALLGDPTLRQDVVAPPGALTVRRLRSGAAKLTWRRASEPVLGYHVYRAGATWERLTTRPIDGLLFQDASAPAGARYMVRAVQLQRAPTGSYFNLSQGVRAE